MCSVFDVLALSEVVNMRKEAGRRHEKRERTESRRTQANLYKNP